MAVLLTKNILITQNYLNVHQLVNNEQISIAIQWDTLQQFK